MALGSDYQYLINSLQQNNPGMYSQFNSLNGNDAEQLRLLSQYNLGIGAQGYVANAGAVTDPRQRLYTPGQAYTPYSGQGANYVAPNPSSIGVVRDANSNGGFSFGGTTSTPGTTGNPAIMPNLNSNPALSGGNSNSNLYTGFGGSNISGSPTSTTQPGSQLSVTGNPVYGGGNTNNNVNAGTPITPGQTYGIPIVNGAITPGAPAGTHAPAGYYAGTVPGTPTTPATTPTTSNLVPTPPAMPRLNTLTGGYTPPHLRANNL